MVTGDKIASKISGKSLLADTQREREKLGRMKEFDLVEKIGRQQKWKWAIHVCFLSHHQ